MLAANDILQNRYVILRKLGEGGMGDVYEAKDLRLQTSVALKETKFKDVTLRSAFEHEAQLLAGLRHPALPKVIDHFSDPHGQFLVMEFMAGDDIGALMERSRTRFDVDNVLGWADQLLDALHYLHTRRPPVIHRDIKPQNLKLNEDGKVTLLDFGLAKTMAAGTIIPGYSNHYSSPEQKRGASTDHRSDLYSLAATLYYLLTGVKPADAQDREAAVASGLPDPLHPLGALDPQMDAAIALVLMQALSLKPEERPASANQMRALLQNAGLSQVTVKRQPIAEDAEPRRLAVPLGASNPLSTLSGNPPPPSEIASVVSSEATRSPVEVKARSSPGPRARLKSQTKATMMSRIRNWSALNFYATGVGIIVAIIGIGVSVYFALHSKPEHTKTGGGNENASIPPPLTREISYFIELIDRNEQRMLSNGNNPLNPDQEFKLHFKPRLQGYLYIIAPGSGNRLETVLTAQPPPGSGLTSNAAAADEDFIFPKTPDQWIGLRDDAFVTPFTVIFSPSPLTTPSFLTGPSGRTLTLAEQEEFETFRKQYRMKNDGAVRPEQSDPNTVTVNLPEGRLAGKPLVFDISLKRR